MLFLGIDLAWSKKNNSGIAVIEGNESGGALVYADIALSDREILDFVSRYAKKGNALIAVDAPLIVPNNEGRRLAEAIVGDLFRKYNAGAHPSNRTRLGAWSEGKIRGEELVKELDAIGFSHNPVVKKFETSRKVFEVYPHPSMVVLFNLNKILQYKAKPKRTLEFRVREFERYKKFMNGLKNPPLKIRNKRINADLSKLTITELKRYEDMLDAVFCAYIAYYYWVNPDRCAVLGNMKEGYIMTPIFEHMKGEQRALR